MGETPTEADKMKNSELVNKFVNDSFGFEGMGSHLIFEKVGTGCFAYSYGRHFPLALRLGNTYIVNTDKYSKTTSRHQSLVANALLNKGGCEVREATTKQLKELEGKFFSGDIKTRDDLILNEI